MKTKNREHGRVSLVERVRLIIDPNYPIKRARAAYLEMLLDIEKKRSAFKAAERNRLNANWSATGSTINEYLQGELTTMRNRSRWLLRNMPDAISTMNAFISYCIGNGIKPIATVYDKIKLKDETGRWYYEQIDNDVFNEECDDDWEDWSTNVDVASPENSPGSFYDSQELALRKWIEDGEAFIHIVSNKNVGGVPLFLEFFEPESLVTTMTEAPATKNKIVMGVELNSAATPVAYWLAGTNGKTIRYPADTIFHVFHKQRPGQVRGYPMLHGVMDKMFQAEEYVDAELTACKIAACLSVFFERAPGLTPEGDLLPANTGGSALDTEGNSISHIQPGMIGSVPAGSNLHVVSPQKPGATFAMFLQHIQHKIAAGSEIGLSYEAMTRDTSQVSYASGRLGMQRDYQGFRQVIAFMNRRFNVPFRNKWMDFAVTSGALECDGYYNASPRNQHDKNYWRRHEWIPPAWQYGVNPKDDVAASRDSMRAGISTLDIECAFMGRDWRTVLRMMSKIKRTSERLGITLTSDGSVSVVNGVEDNSVSEENNASAEPARTGDDNA